MKIICRKFGYNFLYSTRGGFLERTIIKMETPRIFYNYLGTKKIFWRIM